MRERTPDPSKNGNDRATTTWPPSAAGTAAATALAGSLSTPSPPTSLEEGADPRERYVPQARLGEGAFGAVYRALDRATQTPVAIKVINLDECADEIESIQQEVAVMSQLNSEHVAKFYTSFAVGPELYIIMEYVDGGSAWPHRGSGVPSRGQPGASGYQGRQRAADVDRRREAGRLWGQRHPDEHLPQTQHHGRHAVLDGTRGDPGERLRREGRHLVAGYHLLRDGRRVAALRRPTPDARPIPHSQERSAVPAASAPRRRDGRIALVARVPFLSGDVSAEESGKPRHRTAAAATPVPAAELVASARTATASAAQNAGPRVQLGAGGADARRAPHSR
eukprot:ctg_4752.g667